MTIKEKVFKFNFILLTIFLIVILFINGALILIFNEINTQQINNQLSLNKNIYKKIIWTLCQGQLKKECELMKLEDDFCIGQESSFLNSIGIFHYCSISYIFLLLFLHLLGFYKYLIQSHLSYDQRMIP